MIEPWDDDALQARLAGKTLRADGACWLWSGAKVRGRAVVNYRGSMVSAPRLIKTIADRQWPDASSQACHSCDEPACLNPDHIWWGSNLENSHDAVAKGRLHHQKRTNCAQGHLLSGENLRHSKGRRICRACAAERQRKWRAAIDESPVGEADAPLSPSSSPHAPQQDPTLSKEPA